jgi:branched-chain amino acid transport system permease protein
MYLFKESWMFPISLLIGGGAACLAGMILAIPSFKVRGDYLAIITLGFSLIIKSALQNIEFVGAARGLRPIPNFTNLIVVYVCVILSILAVKAFINSKYGRSLLAIRDDQVASELVSVDVRKNKFVAFSFSSILIGISGALLCHLLSYTNPNAFGFTTIVDGLIMVYLGGVASISGSIIGATAWQILVQSLRTIGTWRWIGGGFILVLVMIFLPKGICGNKEITIKGIKELITKIAAFIKRKTDGEKEGNNGQ